MYLANDRLNDGKCLVQRDYTEAELLPAAIAQKVLGRVFGVEADGALQLYEDVYAKRRHVLANGVRGHVLFIEREDINKYKVVFRRAAIIHGHPLVVHVGAKGNTFPEIEHDTATKVVQDEKIKTAEGIVRLGFQIAILAVGVEAPDKRRARTQVERAQPLHKNRSDADIHRDRNREREEKAALLAQHGIIHRGKAHLKVLRKAMYVHVAMRGFYSVVRTREGRAHLHKAECLFCRGIPERGSLAHHVTRRGNGTAGKVQHTSKKDKYRQFHTKRFHNKLTLLLSPKIYVFGEQIEHRQSAKNAAYRENGLFLQDVEKAAPIKAQPLVSRE